MVEVELRRFLVSEVLCVCVCACVCMYVCMYMGVHACAFRHVCVCVHIVYV